MTSPSRGFLRSKSASSLTASMNSSVMATEMLKLLIWSFSFLQVMNSSISG